MSMLALGLLFTAVTQLVVHVAASVNRARAVAAEDR